MMILGWCRNIWCHTYSEPSWHEDSPGPPLPPQKMHPELPRNKYFSSFGQLWVIKSPPYYKSKDFLTKINWNEVGKILLRFWQKKMLDFCPWRTIYPPQRKAFPLIWHIRNGLNNLDWEKWRPVRKISFQNWTIHRQYQQNTPYRYQMKF